MREMRRILALCLVALLLTGCGQSGGTPDEIETPSLPVSSEPVDSEAPEETPSALPDDPVPDESQPAQEQPRPYEVEEALLIEERELPGVRRYSALGYSMAYAPSEITLNDWGGGETYEVTNAEGSYVAVSTIGGSNIGEAVAGLQFEYAIEDEAEGVLFGAKSYAGVRLTVTAGGLTAEYILYQGADTIYLVERAVFTGGEKYELLLQAMLDSISFE